MYQQVLAVRIQACREKYIDTSKQQKVVKERLLYCFSLPTDIAGASPIKKRTKARPLRPCLSQALLKSNRAEAEMAKVVAGSRHAAG